MDFGELQELIRILEASSLAEIEIEEEGRRVRLTKLPPAAHAASPVEQINVGNAGATQEDAQPAPDEDVSGLVTIDSPMVGTFYAAPSAGEEAFVLAGDTIEPDQTVCIVEAMKIMNTVKAKFPAIVEKVLVENGQPVEYGQPLFSVRPLV